MAIHILNVGHGDSIVVEYSPPGRDRVFGLIDSNSIGGDVPPALAKLDELGATALSFIAVTHPHADHYLGIGAVIEKFRGNVGKLYTFPIEQAKLRKVAELLRAKSSTTDSPSATRSILEFLQLLRFGHSMKDDWHTDAGPGHPLVPPGFEGIRITQLLPPGRIRGKIIQDLEKGNLNFEAPNQNDISMAFLLEYHGHQFLLGGDGTEENWKFQNRQWDAMGISPASIVVKLPHHASRHDSSPAVIDILFSKIETDNRVACISADGRTHPANDVLDDLISRGIKPYCTNLAARCGAARTEKLESESVDPAVLRYLGMFAEAGAGKKIQPCQGNITIRVSSTGELTIETEYNHPCAYRGDYDRMFGSLTH